MATVKQSRKGKRTNTPRKKFLATKDDISCARLKCVPASNEASEEYQPAAGLFEAADVEGKSVFQFTPFKKKRTPKATKKMNSENSKCSSSSKKQLNSEKETHEEKLRYSSRMKMKQKLSGMETGTVDSDIEDSDENISSDEGSISHSSNSELESANASDSAKKKKCPISSFAEPYFFAQKQSKAGTSNRTLSNVKLEQTNMQELQDILHNIPEYHDKERSCLYKEYESHFEKWVYLLMAGFNILIHGIGSKRKILNSFCKEYLEDSLYIVIHGFFPTLNIKQILSAVTEDGLQLDKKFSNVNEHVEFLKKYFSEDERELIMIIHSMDGVALRGMKMQTIFSSLASAPNIRFIASVDHINAPLMWDQAMLSQFNWIWYDGTTFEPYITETSYGNSIFKDQSSHLVLSSLLHVYHSLTPNGRGVFLILAKHQQEEKSASNSGMTFQEWYQECREAFLVNSEITMQSQLSEFKNHKLLSSRKLADGIELWYIPVDAVTLEKFLESCEDDF